MGQFGRPGTADACHSELDWVCRGHQVIGGWNRSLGQERTTLTLYPSPRLGEGKIVILNLIQNLSGNRATPENPARRSDPWTRKRVPSVGMTKKTQVAAVEYNSRRVPVMTRLVSEFAPPTGSFAPAQDEGGCGYFSIEHAPYQRFTVTCDSPKNAACGLSA